VLHRSDVTRRLARCAEQPLDRLMAGSVYYIEPFARADAWPDALAPVIRKIPLALQANDHSSSSPSQ
jgi:hypothetical protein